jgi:hypothetical protein
MGEKEKCHTTINVKIRNADMKASQQDQYQNVQYAVNKDDIPTTTKHRLL